MPSVVRRAMACMPTSAFSCQRIYPVCLLRCLRAICKGPLVLWSAMKCAGTVDVVYYYPSLARIDTWPEPP
ncbi:hypothetical protein I7I48_12272 [Histoplasma ohiense]|nr:hypothetical protein I7I48_12272 [Histoplasma ohiense (nom. inval.)]